MAGGPIIFFGLLEGGLRLAGTGYAPEFFLRASNAHITNEKFGWRLFPRPIARTPNPEFLPDAPPRNRVFVLGESAAMGFPDPALGLPAFLQSALGSDWQVVNAAMTAINSHIVREIAVESAALRPRAFVIYMGNNEVIGPYGAGSVFGAFSGNIALIRAQLWARSLRLGQLVEALRKPSQPGLDEWRGLQFFLQNQVPAGDPRLARVYHHFRDNLRQIIRAGHRSGARVIVSTVAVNLKDCPPFAPGGEAQRAFDRGSYAEARDLDVLRFRADSTINAIIREVAGSENATLIDAEHDIEQTAANFWEHVHLRPVANRRLAEQIAFALTAERKPAVLAVTPWDEHRLHRTIQAIMERPPFTAANRERLSLSPPPKPDPAQARIAWEQRVHDNPDDLVAAERLAELQTQLRDFAAAGAIYRSVLARLPLRSWHTGLGECLLNQGRLSEAAESYRAALKIDPQFAAAYVGLGVVHAAQNDMPTAEADLRRAVALQPHLAEAHNNLGRILQSQGSLPEALLEYQLAIGAKPDFTMARYNLAGLLAGLKRVPEAIGQLEAALAIEPGFAPAHYDLGLLLASLGRLDEAIPHYAESLRLNPNNPDALNNWGTALARRHRSAEARRRFEMALALDPRHAAARRNLALLKQPVTRE